MASSVRHGIQQQKMGSVLICLLVCYQHIDHPSDRGSTGKPLRLCVAFVVALGVVVVAHASSDRADNFHNFLQRDCRKHRCTSCPGPWIRWSSIGNPHPIFLFQRHCFFHRGRDSHERRIVRNFSSFCFGNRRDCQSNVY